MSELIEALDFIEAWVQQNRPDHPAIMSPGLSREEIEKQVQHLPFKLPEEIYDLYQKYNGGKNSFLPDPDGWDLASFPSLKENLSNVDSEYPLFPIFYLEYGLYFVICTEQACDALPVYCSDTPEECLEGDEEPQYPSLTAMMQELGNDLRNKIREA